MSLRSHRCDATWFGPADGDGADRIGQRPKLPFEDIFDEGDATRAFPRDPEVVTQLEQAGLFRAPAPTPGRFEELKRLMPCAVRVAVWVARGELMRPVGVNRSVRGS